MSKVKLLLLHGNSALNEVWRPLCDELSSKLSVDYFELNYPNNLFNPEKQWSKAYILDCLYRQIPDSFLERSVVIGHSLGGHLAIDLAQKLNKLQALILLQCSPAQDLVSLSEYFNKDSLPGQLLFNKNWSESEFKQICEDLSYPHSVTEGFKSILNGSPSKLREDLGQSLVSEGLRDEWKALDGLSCSKHLILSDKDKVLNTDYIQIALKKHGSLMIHTTQALGHYGFYYQPKVIAQTLFQILSSL